MSSIRRPEKIRLGDLLVQQGLMDEATLQTMLAKQKELGVKLGKLLVQENVLSDVSICKAIAHQLRMEFVDLTQRPAPPNAVRNYLTEPQARRYRAIALEDNGFAIKVGMSDPSDLFAYDELTAIIKRPVDVVVISDIQLDAYLNRVYTKSEEISGLAKELGKNLEKITFDTIDVNTASDDAPVVKLIQNIFEDALRLRASDIHVEPMENELQIRFRIDGDMHIQTRAESRIASALSLRLKLMSGLDISEKRLPQDGRFSVDVSTATVDVRISTLPTQYGESIVMRLLAQNASLTTLDKLDMPPHVLETFKAAIHKPHGIILVTGPTGSGKTSALYAALREISTPENKTITVEDPIEYRLDGLNQVQVNEKIELSFAKVLRAVLRQDPDIVLVGEMRDEETAQIAVRAALTGHLVLSTVHTNDACSTPVRVIDMGVPRFLLASSLLGVMAQRLLRRLCKECAQPYTPTPQDLVGLSTFLSDETLSTGQYKQPAGCTHCNHTGYNGRAGIFEYLEINLELAEAINHADIQIFQKQARKILGDKTMYHHAAHRAVRGEITVADALRIASEWRE